MIIRLRRSAALLALLALATSGVEQAWGAACGEMDGMPPAASVVAETQPATGAHAGHGSPAVVGDDGSAPGDHRSHTAPESATCPVAAAAGMGCGVAALPIISTSDLPAPTAPAALTRTAERAPGFLALSSLFRPPRP